MDGPEASVSKYQTFKVPEREGKPTPLNTREWQKPLEGRDFEQFS